MSITTDPIWILMIRVWSFQGIILTISLNFTLSYSSLTGSKLKLDFPFKLWKAVWNVRTHWSYMPSQSDFEKILSLFPLHLEI